MEMCSKLKAESTSCAPMRSEGMAVANAEEVAVGME